MPLEERAFPVKHLELFHTSLVWAFDSEVAKIYNSPRYGPYPIAAWWLKQGSVTLTFGKTKETYQSGHWIFPRFSEGTQAFSHDARMLSIRFYAEWPNGRMIFDRSRTISFPVAEAPELTQAATRLLSGGPHQEGKSLDLTLGQFLKIRPLFNQWISAYYNVMIALKMEPSSSGVYSEKVRHVLFYLKHRPLQTPLQDKELATIAGLSVSQLHRLFAKELGISPLGLWNQRRLEIARFYLQDNKDSVKLISFTLGFSSPEHFCKWFKQQTNLSPREYRKLPATAFFDQ